MDAAIGKCWAATSTAAAVHSSTAVASCAAVIVIFNSYTIMTLLRDMDFGQQKSVYGCNF